VFSIAQSDGVAAAVVEAAAGVLAAVSVLAMSVLLSVSVEAPVLDFSGDAVDLSPPFSESSAFFRDSDGYSVTYHPSPFRMNGAGESRRRTAPPHASHRVNGSAVIRCHTSKVR